MPERYDQALINGRLVTASGDDGIEVADPSTEEVVSVVRAASEDDVTAAVQAACDAAPALARTSLDERRDMLGRLLDAYVARTEDYTSAVVDEIGLPEDYARDVQVETGRLHIEEARIGMDDVVFEKVTGSTVTQMRPVGVTAMITPWNWPLTQIALKVAPALAAGCTAVLKPSEFSPRQTAIFMDTLMAAGLPDGAVNVINGLGPDIGASLVARPQIDFVSFTGSTAAGVAVTQASAARLGHVALELGGKSPAVVLDDADLSAVIPEVVDGCFANNGQSCDAPTRLLVPRSMLDEAVDVVREACAAQVVGDPRTNPDVTLGPVINSRQFGRIQELINAAIEEGSDLLAGGPGRPDGLERGYFNRPTAFLCQTPRDRIAVDEVFGSVLAVIAYDSDEEAVAIANDTTYGLASFVFSGDHDRALATAQVLDAGQVHVNGIGFDAKAPFGGRKMSGLGRECGPWGIEEFLEPVAVLGANV